MVADLLFVDRSKVVNEEPHHLRSRRLETAEVRADLQHLHGRQQRAAAAATGTSYKTNNSTKNEPRRDRTTQKPNKTNRPRTPNHTRHNIQNKTKPSESKKKKRRAAVVAAAVAGEISR